MLEGKVAFITGSTRGIGWSVAEVFASKKAAVILNGRSDKHRLDECVSLLQERYGVVAHGIMADVADPQAVAASYKEIFAKFQRLDILVNNAGVLQDHLLGMVPQAAINSTFAVNTLGTLYNLQAASRLMTRHKQGSIINVSSIIGTNGNSGQVVYGGSKAAVIGMTKSAAKELAPNNIRVNAIAPGFIDTDMVRHLSEKTFGERMASIKMGRIGRPEEVANAILFLASDLSSYITGQVIGVDGGMLI